MADKGVAKTNASPFYALGDAIKLLDNPTTSYRTIVIVMVILILIAVVVFLVVVILYRQGRIFKRPQSFEVEMDKRALTQLEKARAENRLLTHVNEAPALEAGDADEDVEMGEEA